MQFTIYSVGDSIFLEQILIAVAMVTSTNSFTQMVSVGLLIGVIIITVQSVFQGAKQINFQQVLIGYLLYACFFVPTTRVLIDDVYTGQVRVVDNVPLGVGAAGGIISSVGYNITNLFEQGYGVIIPYSTENRPMESLQILNDTRKMMLASPIQDAMDTAVNGDLRWSWNNYIRECTLTAVDLGSKKISDIYMGSELVKALEFKSDLYGTRLKFNGSEANYTCTEAYTLLAQATNVAAGSYQTKLALDDVVNQNTNPFAVNKAADIIDSSLSMMGAVSTNATKYMITAMLEPIYYEAAEGKYQDFQDVASAITINQAIQQRNSQWAAEQSMFMTTVRPLMTFFEGFVYGITPFMGFLIVLGAFGIGLAGKYFQTLLWIQLWLPVMSIIQLYIFTATTARVEDFGAEFTSMYAIDTAGQIFQNYIAVGGMMMASTPIISLFIVTGSTYAFTSLAGRISGGDHIDEKNHSKDLMKQGPVMQGAASNQYNDVTGMAGTGAADLMGSISFGSGMSSMKSSTEQRMQASQQAFASSIGSAFSSSMTDSQIYSNAAQIGRTHAATHGTESGVINQRTNQIMKSGGFSDSHANTVRGIVSAVGSGTISASVGTKLLSGMLNKGVDENEKPKGAKASAQGTINASASKETADGNQWSREDRSAINDALSFSDSEKSSLTNNLAESFTNASQRNQTVSLAGVDTETLTKSAQDVTSSNKAYSEASNLSQTYGQMNEVQLAHAGNRVGRDENSMARLNNYWNSGGVSQSTKQEADRLYQRYSAPTYEGGMGLDSKSALAAARIKALVNSNNNGISDQQYQSNFNAATSIVGDALGLNTGTAGGYDQHSGLRDVNNGSLRHNATANAERAGANTAAAKQVAATGPTLQNTTPLYRDPVNAAQPSAAVTGEAGRFNNEVLGTASNWENELRGRSAGEVQQHLLATGPEFSRMSAAEFYGGAENLYDWVDRRREQLFDSGKAVFNSGTAGAAAASEGFSQRLDELKNNPEARAQAIAAIKMSDEQLKESGMGGQVLNGLSQYGRAIIGQAALGMELATGQMSWSDLKDTSIQEKGMIYSAALSYAAEQGGSAAVASLQQHEFKDFQQDFRNFAKAKGLNDVQAEVFATAHDGFGLSKIIDPNGAPDTSERQAAIQNLTNYYAEYDSQGNITNQDWINYQVNAITEAARGGSTASGSYLTGLAMYNIASGQGQRSIVD